ncbi:MAG: NAD-dependent malic enzyme [Gemmatimonadales bacterium]|nr:NAD-dependent malic enzyme [Gemmatimonadales bacterium]
MPKSSNLRGADLLLNPRHNKGTAFTEAERDQLGLRGLLPPRVFTLEEQEVRILDAFRGKATPLEKYIYLSSLQDRNETLFYKVISGHLAEMMPIIYTPTVGEACRVFSRIFRRPRGLYITSRDKGRIRESLRNWPAERVSVIVVTDGERILGLGDLGAHGMGIPIGKLALYTACAGIPPAECLPISIDVGTENAELRADPLYTGLLQPRIRGAEYDALLEEFVEAVQDVFPGVLLQWEDFATDNAFGLLARYRNRLCTFNDDIQGTAAVTLSGLLSATRITGQPLAEQRLLFLGAGSAATGIGELIVNAIVREGVPVAEARAKCWFVDSRGLVVAARTDLQDYKRPFAHEHPPVASFLEAVQALKPTAILGLAAQPGAFSPEVLRAMAAQQERPIIFALSNPTSKSECTAEAAYTHTEGRGVFASGSPFDPVTVHGRTFVPGQGNNAYIFPGLGLGAVVAGATRVTDAMFHAAAQTLANYLTEDSLAQGSLFPPLAEIREVSARIAEAVVRVAQAEGLATAELPEDIAGLVRRRMYQPRYPEYVPTA